MKRRNLADRVSVTGIFKESEYVVICNTMVSEFMLARGRELREKSDLYSSFQKS